MASTLSIPMCTSLSNCGTRLAAEPRGLRQLLSKPGAGQVLGMNTLPLSPRGAAPTQSRWEPIPLLLQQLTPKCIFYTGSQTCSVGGRVSYPTLSGCLPHPSSPPALTVLSQGTLPGESRPRKFPTSANMGADRKAQQTPTRLKRP